MTSFCARLEAAARGTGSLLCVGLDPHPADLPQPTAGSARDFCLRLIEATDGLAAAYKPNAAFFEALGAPGWAALGEVIAAAPQGIPVILDAKRGDITSTAAAYARSAFDVLGADALTVSPYLGRDGLEPFLADPAKGAFVLCKTSNPGSGDLQDLRLADRDRLLYEHVASLCQAWNERDNLGVVAGATHPLALARVRACAPGLWILAPGVGAQGGELAAALHAGLRRDGLGLLIPVSRAIARAADPRRAAQEVVDEMRQVQDRAAAGDLGVGAEPNPPAPFLPSGLRYSEWGDLLSQRRGGVGGEVCAQTVKPGLSQPKPASRAEVVRLAGAGGLAEALLDTGCVRFGQFRLKSGLESPVYLDLRQLVSFPGVLAMVAEEYVKVLHGLAFDRLAALPYAALPIGTAVSLQGGWPLIYPRKETKGYGTGAEIEGRYAAGERAVIVDDLATTGGSKFEAIDKLKAAGLQVKDVVVLIDRQSGAAEALASAGYKLHAILTLSELLDYWETVGRVPAADIAAARAFLAQTQ